MMEGRDIAMSALRDALGDAARGKGRLAVVSGDAGIGKSTVATAIASEAEAAGFDVTWGRAWEFADAPPYFPLRGALRTLGIDPHRADLRDEGGSFRLWEEVVEALARAPKPIAWVLEDLHAADLLTLDLLTFLAQAVRGLRVLVVATTRAQDPRLDERALQRLTRMGRDGIDLRLAPLVARDIGAVAAHVCGAPLPTAVVAKLAEITGGNPLFVVECARAFKQAGTLTALPPTVKQVVLDRFMQLGAETRAVLACGAILGREFTASVVARMRDALPARVIDATMTALRSGLVIEIEPGRFAFSHVIVRDVVDSTLGAEERAKLHGLAGAALAKAPDSVEAIVERARHALEAAAMGDAQHAVDLARRAIDVLEQDGAHDRAYAICERLVGADASAQVASSLSADDWMRYARIARAAGRHAESRRLCERVIADARTRKDAPTFARATLLLGAELRPGIVDRTLISLLEEAIALIGDEDASLTCRLTARLGGALQPHDDYNVPIAIARGAIERARSLGDEVLIEVLDLGVSALVDFAPIDERLAAYGELLALANARGDRPRVLRARARLAVDHAYVGDFAAFASDVDESLQVASGLGHPRHRWRALLLSSKRSMLLGELADSERAIVEARELSSMVDDPALPLTLIGHELHRALIIQREDELRRIADDLPKRFAMLSYGEALSWWYRFVIAGIVDDEETARAALSALGDTLRFFERELSSAALGARALALAGTEEHRRRVRAFLEPHAAHHAVGGHVAISYDGPIARALAFLDESLGETSSAFAHLGRALAVAKQHGHRTWIAKLEYDTAAMLVRAKRNDEARAAAERASALASEIGLDALAERARSLVTEAPRTPSPTTARKSFGLTREGDVWRVTYDDRTLRVRDTRGMHLLARLVERPDEEIHVLALATDEVGTAGLAESNAGDVLDDKAKNAYRERLRDLADEIDEAERNADRGRLERLRRERAMIEEEISRAVGLGGRARKGGSTTERARVNVQRRVKDAIARIAEADPAVGHFLERAVRTGTFCCYRP